MKANPRIFANAARSGCVRVLSSFRFHVSSFPLSGFAQFSAALLLSLSLALPSFAAAPLTPVAPRSAPLTGLDSLRALAAKADTAGTKSRADTTVVVMHPHNHRQQIITGSVIMACLAGVMVVMNNYNPRPVNQF